MASVTPRNPLQQLQQNVSQCMLQWQMEAGGDVESGEGHPDGQQGQQGLQGPDSDALEGVEGSRVQLIAGADRWQRSQDDKRELLDCLSSHASHLESEVLRAECLEAETAEQLALRQEKLTELAEQSAEISSSGEVVASKENNRDALEAKKKLYYMLTRIVWNKGTSDEDKVKGFVLNPIKNDVTTFTVRRKEQADDNSANFLWDYIASGVSNV